MAVTFKRLTKFHPYEPAKCNSFVVGEFEWSSVSYCSVRHHPCFFLGALLCPLYMLYQERMSLLLHDRENFVCCVKCPRWQRYEGACISPELNPVCNVLEIVLCPVCSIENNRHTIRKYYNITEEPQLRCLRMECQCAKFGREESDGSSSDESGGEGEGVREENAERAQPLSWVGALLMTVLQNPGSCICGCFGYLSCLACRALHIPFLLSQHRHELNTLKFPVYRTKTQCLLDTGFGRQRSNSSELNLLML
jgi:hypothetical protein